MVYAIDSITVGPPPTDPTAAPTVLYNASTINPTIGSTTLRDNSNRVKVTLYFDAPGTVSIGFAVDGILQTTLSANISTIQVNRPYAMWFTYPKARDIPGEHVISVAWTGQLGLNFPFTIEAAPVPTTEEIAAQVSASAADLWEWIFQQRGLVCDTVDVNGQPAVRERWTSPAGITIPADQPITISSYWMGKSQPWPIYNGQRAPRDIVISQPYYISAVVDGVPLGIVNFDQGFEYDNVENRTVQMEPGAIPPGPHLVVLRCGIWAQGLGNVFVASPPFRITVEPPAPCSDTNPCATGFTCQNGVCIPQPVIPGGIMCRLAVTADKLNAIFPGSPFSVHVHVRKNGEPVSGPTAALFIDGTKVASDTVMDGEITLDSAVPQAATMGSALRGTVTVSGLEDCNGGETAISIPVARRAGRKIDLFVDQPIIDGLTTTLRAYVLCSGGPSQGESVKFSVDGKAIATSTTEVGLATTTWQPTAIPSRSHKIVALVAKSDVCPLDEAATTSRNVQVFTPREAMTATPTKYGLLAGEEEKVKAELVQLGTPEVLLPSQLPLFTIPSFPGLSTELPGVETPGLPSAPTPTQGYGTIVIPDLGLPVKFADAPVSITIDGIPVGAPPVSQEVKAGTHTVNVSVKGLTPISKRVTVSAGEAQILSGLYMM